MNQCKSIFCQLPKRGNLFQRDFVPEGHYAKITKRENVQEGAIAKGLEGVIVLVGDYSRGCTCQALQEGENARGAKMLGGRVSVSRPEWLLERKDMILTSIFVMY